MAIKNLLPDIWRGESSVHPLREMGRLQRRLDRMFEELFGEPVSSQWESFASQDFTPAWDIAETDSHYLVSFDLPGVKKDDVKIDVRDNQLTISGERKGRGSRERFYGSFSRSFTLPANVNADKIEANYENGVLQIALPKSVAGTGKQIPVKEGKLIEAKPPKGEKAA
jgi:HSP20 family protein